MTSPIDAILAFHNAFRKDLAGIDAAALAAARGNPGSAGGLERYRFFNEMLVWHAAGEEMAIFPALEEVAPLVAEAYVQDHRGLDTAYDHLHESVSARDTLETARASAAFKFHLDMHLGKEDTHLYRLVRERVSLPDQTKAVGVMAGHVPMERVPDMVAWVFPLLGHEDTGSLIRVWQMLMPAEAFAGVKPLLQQAVGKGWAVLVREIPGLAP
jgi:hypothetical protein